MSRRALLVDLSAPTAPRDTAELRKARGAFFTPPALSDFIACWAIRSTEDRVLEPSSGEAAFLLSAAARLDALGAPRGSDRLTGVELHTDSARAAEQLLAGAGRPVKVMVGDFFDVPAERRYDAVIGNPPYVRYQDFTGAARARSRAVALTAGVGLTALASSWAAFTVHAAEFLRPGGRLGLVLPAELLTVNYAAQVRQYLMARFGRVRLVLFTERVFPGVLEEVVLLLAEDALAAGGTSHCELRQVRTAEDLQHEVPATAEDFYRWAPADTRAKWTPALLPAAALDAYAATQARSDFTTLSHWGDTTLGMVTGNNRFFTLSPARATELGLRSAELVPLSPPGSRHLRGLAFTPGAWTELGVADASTWLFRPSADRTHMSPGARAYVAEGEDLTVNQAYKCRARTPWWRVPLVPPADLLLTYMNADTPRLTTNTAGVRHLNSVHGVYLRPAHKSLGAYLLPLASLNTMTLLGAETVGRAYGGGMLKLEPREADVLPVPAPALLDAARDRLTALRPQMTTALRDGRLADAARLVDDVLLIGALGMSRAQVRELEQAHRMLTDRRVSRGRSRPQRSEPVDRQTATTGREPPTTGTRTADLQDLL